MTIPNVPTRGWRDRLFAAAMLFFVAAFTAFVLTLIITDIFYIDKKAVVSVIKSSFIRHALWLSIWTSCTTTFIAILFAIPIGYSLSRYRFPGRALVNTVVDLPIIFPPLVAGLTLLVFFSQTALGRWIQQDAAIEFVFQPKGIVLCQFLVSASFAIRSAKYVHMARSMSSNPRKVVPSRYAPMSVSRMTPSASATFVVRDRRSR